MPPRLLTMARGRLLITFLRGRPLLSCDYLKAGSLSLGLEE